MNFIPLLMIPLLEYLMPVAVGLAIALRLFKQRLTGDLVVSCVIAIVLWLSLVLVLPGKSLTNAVIEPLILAAVILVWEIIRLALEKRSAMSARMLGGVNIAGSLLLTLCVLFLMPVLPE